KVPESLDVPPHWRLLFDFCAERELGLPPADDQTGHARMQTANDQGRLRAVPFPPVHAVASVRSLQELQDMKLWVRVIAIVLAACIFSCAMGWVAGYRGWLWTVWHSQPR